MLRGVSTTQWRLVGRSVEFTNLVEAARGSTGRGLLFGGAAGIGKTRLLRDALATLDPAELAVWQVPANAATAVLPLGSIAPALPAEQPTGMTPAGLLRWSMDSLLSEAGGRAMVFAIDDVHLLDPLSAALVYSLARGGHARVIATLRTGERVPDPVRALWTEDLVDRMELGPLSDVETADLLQEMVGLPFESTSAEQMWSLSQGNPLYLRELVLAASSAGELTEQYGLMRWTGRLVMGAAPSLRELVNTRIGELTPEIRRVVELVAFGEPIGLPMLIEATDQASVELAEERNLIRITTDVRRHSARLGHPIYGEVVRQSCPQTRMQRLLADLADMVEKRGARRRNDPMRTAVWRLDSGTANNPEVLERAARTAFGQYDMRLAIRLGHAAIQAGAGLEAADTLSTTLIFADHPDAALSVIDAAAPKISNDYELSRWIAARAITTHWGLADLGSADRMHEQAKDLPERERLWVTAIEGIMRVHDGLYQQGEQLCREVLDSSEQAIPAHAVAACTLAFMDAYRGKPVTAMQLLAMSEANSVAWRADAPYVQLPVELARGTALILAGNLPAVDAVLLGEFAGLADAGDFRIGSGYLTVVRAQAARIRGQLPLAAKLAQQGCAQLISGQVFAALAFAEQAHVAALAGHPAEAWAALAESDRRHAGNMEALYPWRELARAWVYASAGDLDKARKSLEALVKRLHSDGFLAFELLALHDLIRLGNNTDAAYRLSEVATQTEGVFPDLMLTHALAIRNNEGEGLLLTSREFAKQGLNLYAAEIAAEAVRALRREKSPQLPAAMQELSAYRALCPGAQTPALASPAPNLTARQRQIARRAAAGVTSKQIAEEFFLSARTVDNHLRRIYSRLGVNSRVQLAAELRNLPPDP
jgi:DNA-binding CsgD family transcriptional regulator